MSTQTRIVILLLQAAAIAVGIMLGVAFWNGVS
jgi:hypothetical protein